MTPPGVTGATGVSINGVACDARPGMSLFECAESVGVLVPTSCHKQGKCRECLVEVESGDPCLTPRTAEEDHLAGQFRLSCRARVASLDGPIRCHTMRRGSMRIETGTTSLSDDFELDPVSTGDAAEAGPRHGLAVDVGTTTVALRLHDLSTGALVATRSFENPQRFGGSEIMARIRYDGEHPGRLLQRTLLGYLGHAIEDLPCDPATIREMVVAGNTTMRDLFFGLDVQPVGVIPYRSTVETAFREGRAPGTSVTASATKLRLPAHPRARVYGLPLIGSHVGGDTAACLLATGLAERTEVSALLDIGTNTEVVVGNRDRILAASCPAGPAFEGGGVTCGMPALEGAIERVRIRDNGSFELGVIGEGPAAGICGSGLVDLLGELLRTGRMNAQGRFADDQDQFPLDEANGISLFERDVNELAQAKGANVAGLRIVMSAFGVSFDSIDRLFLAGGFARHLDLDAARRIGLLPDLPDSRIVQVGNAALHGASIALLSARRRRQIEEVVARVEHVRLETDPAFFDTFVDGCQFVPFGGRPV